MKLQIVSTDGQRREDMSLEMRDALKDVIYSYEGRATIPQVIGVLEIVKMEILEEAEE